jgi:hypothetical protein
VVLSAVWRTHGRRPHPQRAPARARVPRLRHLVTVYPCCQPRSSPGVPSDTRAPICPFTGDAPIRVTAGNRISERSAEARLNRSCPIPPFGLSHRHRSPFAAP